MNFRDSQQETHDLYFLGKRYVFIDTKYILADWNNGISSYQRERRVGFRHQG